MHTPKSLPATTIMVLIENLRNSGDLLCIKEVEWSNYLVSLLLRLGLNLADRNRE
jgi:hypothetical protein